MANVLVTIPVFSDQCISKTRDRSVGAESSTALCNIIIFRFYYIFQITRASLCYYSIPFLISQFTFLTA